MLQSSLRSTSLACLDSVDGLIRVVCFSAHRNAFPLRRQPTCCPGLAAARQQFIYLRIDRKSPFMRPRGKRLGGGPMTVRGILPLVLLLLLTPMLRAGGNRNLSPEDIAKIKQAHSQYESSWLKGDADGVHALFTD